MNLDKFYQYLENPKELGSTSLAHLTELIEEYPFFQTAHLLYLKNLQVLENIKFNKQLKLTAAYMYDRKFLFEFLNRPSHTTTDRKEDDKQVEINIDEQPELLAQVENNPEPVLESIPIPEPVPEPVTEPLMELVPEPTPIPEPVSEVVSEPISEPEPEPVSESVSEPVPETEATVRRPIRVFKNQEIIGSVEDQIASEPLVEHKDFEADLSETVLPPDIEISNKPDEAPITEKDSGLEAESDIYKKTDYLNSIERFIPIADIDVLMFDFPSGNKDDLLEFEFDQLVPDFNPDTSIEQPEPDADYHSRITSHALIEQFIKTDPLQSRAKPVPDIPVASHKNKPESEPESQKISHVDNHNKDLLDAFLMNQPRIPAPSSEKHVVLDDISMESLQDDESFMTETLAGIYMKQGYYLKAIKAYEKLSLKYPEKSIYFATQIEKIKELINNQ